jgi:ppGpp synthetase/RelA/SpoT-type nucleotidyltranferase
MCRRLPRVRTPPLPALNKYLDCYSRLNLSKKERNDAKIQEKEKQLDFKKANGVRSTHLLVKIYNKHCSDWLTLKIIVLLCNPKGAPC